MFFCNRFNIKIITPSLRSYCRYNKHDGCCCYRNSFDIKIRNKAQNHYKAAITFQQLRRELEEEIVHCWNGKIKENYDSLRKEWTDILKQGLPLPQKVFDRFRQEAMDTLSRISPAVESLPRIPASFHLADGIKKE